MTLQQKLNQLAPLCKPEHMGTTALELNADVLAINAASIYGILAGQSGSLGHASETLDRIIANLSGALENMKKTAMDLRDLAKAQAA